MQIVYYCIHLLAILSFFIGNITDNKIILFIAAALFVPVLVFASIDLVKVLREEKDARNKKNANNEIKE
jgi:hypothetical protein